MVERSWSKLLEEKIPEERTTYEEEENSSDEEENSAEEEEKSSESSEEERKQEKSRRKSGNKYQRRRICPLSNFCPASCQRFLAGWKNDRCSNSSYETSTKACDFSDVEKLARLQECLRGEALKAVRRRLLLPKPVPKMIKTMRMLYGLPKRLLNMLLSKVHNAVPPKVNRLASFISSP